MEESDILEAFFARREEAIRHTDALYGKRLLHLAENILKNAEDAQECVSDTYFRTWETIPPQRPGNLFAYLAKLCRNAALDRLDWNRAAKREAEIVTLTQEMEACIPDSFCRIQPENREIGRMIDAFLRTQPKENQVIFLRRYWYADSIAEIAASCDLSEGAVQMRLSRMKDKLRNYLKKEGIRV